MERNLGWLMSRAGLSWRTVIDRYMAELELTQTRWVAMLVLDKVGEGCTQKVLAANVGIEQPSLVRTLGQLEEAGLIERRTSPDDARCRTLWFTPAGRKLLGRMERLANEGRERLLEGLSDRQRQQLHHMLEVVLGNAQDVLEGETS